MTAGLITRFADLAASGVHENIIRALTQDLRYETMTDVQAMSINPALSGKDMYVDPPPRAAPHASQPLALHHRNTH